MNVIYRVHGAGGFYMETQSQDQAFRSARQEAAASGQMALVSFTWAGRYQMRRFFPDESEVIRRGL
jgi:hypothetical protein